MVFYPSIPDAPDADIMPYLMRMHSLHWLAASYHILIVAENFLTTSTHMLR